ncbi:hypothetical protein [Mesorhizobium sp.]|nr:hypothetical protein [Mesorhizobium sp.]
MSEQDHRFTRQGRYRVDYRNDVVKLTIGAVVPTFRTGAKAAAIHGVTI